MVNDFSPNHKVRLGDNRLGDASTLNQYSAHNRCTKQIQYLRAGTVCFTGRTRAVEKIEHDRVLR